MANGNIAGNFGLGSFNLEPFPQGLNPITGVPVGHTYEQFSPPPSASPDGIAALPVSTSNVGSAATSPYAPVDNWGEPVETVYDPNAFGSGAPTRVNEPIGPEPIITPPGVVDPGVVDPGVVDPGVVDPNATAIADLNAQIAALQTQLADANSLYATATTDYEQALAAQQATALTEQQAALEAQKQSMLGERGTLLEQQQQAMLGERGTLLEQQQQAMLGEREALLAEAQTTADTRIAEIQAELEAQATVKAEEIAALEAQLAALGEQLAAAKATADEYKLLAGENSEIGAVAASEAEARYNALLAEYNSLTLQLSESQQQHNALIDESAAVFDQSIVDAQNRQTEYTMIDDTGILVDVENTYLAPTDLYEDATVQRIKEQAASAPAQALAISQYNAFADLLGTNKIGEETDDTDTDTDTDTGTGTGTGTGTTDTAQEFTYQTIYDNFVNNPQYFDLLGIDADATYDEWLEAWQEYMSNIEGLGL